MEARIGISKSWVQEATASPQTWNLKHLPNIRRSRKKDILTSLKRQIRPLRSSGRLNLKMLPHLGEQ